ncbi:hypothetical protein TRFO_23906 [Tritrichomonas foetus]|uniref:MHD1 domain-containing protein n=1 Tax=Tritrichomonas foetus TaxID=1144522 RepID=A0A1J4KA39_9EUKA|nr:hypothetical protein TRFO_23906 [Tritrichomonas foetus]|eukprot:OHT07792.1 hypothetical protein TRFO_23906 [Tritrichomonas foetus]
MGRENSSKSFGNSLVRIQFPNVESAVAIFHYNKKKYSIQARDRQIEAVFPVFRGQTLQIDYKLNKKIFDKNRMVIESLTETGELRGTVMINKKVSNIIINYTYYQMDQVIPNLSNYLNMNPSSLFDFAVECFIREFIYKNKEEETETNEQDDIITSCESDELLADLNNPDSKMFNNQNENNQADSENNKEKLSTKHKLKHKSWRKSKAKTEIIHHDKNKKKRKHKSKDRKKKRAEDLLNGIEEGEDIENHAFNKRVFPVDFWLFLCDLAMKYSLPCSYFFTKIVEKLTDCWCNSQAFVSLYCVMIYSLYYSHNNENSSPEEKKDFQLFLYFAKKNAKTLLANQLAKPELYEKTSITSLVLILSLCLDNNKLSTILEEIFIASQDNIFKSIHKKLKFEKSENECISMGLYTITYSGFQEFDVGPNGLPLCNITPESLIDALKLVSLRCKSISAFYLNQFLPSFLNIEQKSLEDLALITINIADTFTKIYPLPAQQLLAQFVIVYKEVYSVLKEYKLIHPSVLFNTPIINWLTDLSQSAIEETDRSILFDPFEKYSDNVKTSPSLVDLFRFFEQGFSFIKGLLFTRGELENKLTVFFSICASMVSNYIDQILSIAALPFRMINAHKGKFPSWIPDCYFAQRHITVRQMFVIINNLCNIPQYWEKFLQKYVSYCQINESEEEINHIRQIKDPRLKLNEKVLFTYNFIRLDTVYNITELLMPKLWSLGKIGLIRAKLLRDDFSIITFENLLNDVLDIFRNKVASMMEDLQETQFIKCLPHIVRGVEEGVFECLIPFAFSTKAKLLKEMIGKCSAMFQEMLKYINCLFQNNNTIIMKCKEKITFLPYVETHLNFRGKDLEMILQVEKKVQNFDHVILVNMLMQANSVAPLPKPMNESFTFIRLS